MTHSYVWHTSFIPAIRLFRKLSTSQLYAWPDSIMCVTWNCHLFSTLEKNDIVNKDKVDWKWLGLHFLLNVWPDSMICVPWNNHLWGTLAENDSVNKDKVDWKWLGLYFFWVPAQHAAHNTTRSKQNKTQHATQHAAHNTTQMICMTGWYNMCVGEWQCH